MVKITTATRAELLAEIEARLMADKGFTVATLNLDHIVKLSRDTVFREAYEQHTYVVADGHPIVWLRRLAGSPVDLVAGSDLVRPLLELAARLGILVALFGSTEEVLKSAKDRLEIQIPELRIIAAVAPEFPFDPVGPVADAHLKAIDESGARLCLVALGAPKQEVFAARGREQLPRCGFVSVGAGLDFIAGAQRRAPPWVRGLALEWLWRLVHDWRRLGKRYLACILILPSLTVAALLERFGMEKRGND